MCYIQQILISFNTYLSTVRDDYSPKILAWKLCSAMRAEDVKKTLDLAIQLMGVYDARIEVRPRLLSDNGPSHISKRLQEYLKEQEMGHTRGKPFHPMTQVKIERYHQSLKNIILLDNYFLPMQLEAKIQRRVEYKYLGREEKIFMRRRKIKKQTIRRRREAYRNQRMRAGNSEELPVS